MARPDRLAPSPLPDPNAADRFTLADYVYERDDDSEMHVAAPRAPFAGSSGAGALRNSLRPSSWGLALQGDLANIRGSVAGPSSSSFTTGVGGTTESEKGSAIKQSQGGLSTESTPGGGSFGGMFATQPSTGSPTPLPPGASAALGGRQGSESPPTSTISSTFRRLPDIPFPAASPTGAQPTLISTPPPSSPSYPPQAPATSPIKSLPTLPSLSTQSLHASPSSQGLLHSRPLQLRGMPVSPITPTGLPRSPSYPPEAGPSSPLRAQLGEPSRSRMDTELDVVPSIGRSYRGSAISGVSRDDTPADGEELSEKADNKRESQVPESVLEEPRGKHWWSWLFRQSFFCKLLLGVVITELVIDLIIEGNILWRFNLELQSSATQSMLDNKRRLPIFLIIFGLAHLWQLVLTVIAIRTKNTIQITAITIFNFAFLAWAVIQVSELRTILGDLQTTLDGSKENLLNLPLNVLTAVIIGVVSTGCLSLMILSYFVRREFGWQRYRFLGADLQIRAYYRRFQIFECICYFSAFFCAGFGIQFIWLVLQPNDVEYIITWIMFPVSLILLVIGRTAAKYENKPFMIFFAAGLLLGQAYFLFKLIRIWQQATTVYASVTKSLTVFAIFSLLCLIACLVWAWLVYRVFDKGLKQAVLSQPGSSPSFLSRLGRVSRRNSGSPDGASDNEMSVVKKKRLTIA